ncbi:MAG TPA: MarR family transcriptional regulator [Mycobacterium sp.]|jgi:DNA-binding MarR family transcriptional regulator|nr:MarR family transcriptional regulator [Mycobacterium sp.]
MSDENPPTDHRRQLERRIGADLRELTSESDWMARIFADQNDVSANEFRALLFVMIAETQGRRLTAGDLRRQMGLSGAAITYLVERMTDTGHMRRETDPSDRRKVILRYADRGMAVARSFFTRLAEHSHRALAGLSDQDLETAHRAFVALTDAMRAYRAELPVNPG